ncbi:MAG: hypothetical protein AVDCRST_MAG58-2134 [uncultured Rubrobacteraceae bacterium]|uniref:Uncharacterized protein n=1 Tax=uncultured Rubrobacteraceae bacterium TaxID=349277 RepID=A0A6J4QQY6_9ACTN|nr:MAG: hypothetical protein AVDCRST_MAG58-2134 [uncultured Rubrobacteraceae bacterium]
MGRPAFPARRPWPLKILIVLKYSSYPQSTNYGVRRRWFARLCYAADRSGIRQRREREERTWK